MPTSPGGIRYPSTGGHTDLTLYYQQLAEDIDNIVKIGVASQAARLALASPAQGLLVVEKDSNRVYVKTSTGWSYAGGGTDPKDIPFTPLASDFGWTSRSGGFEVRSGWCAVDINHTRATWGANANINQLPVGARPTQSKYFMGNWAGSFESEIKVSTDGFIVATDGGADGLVISFAFPVA